MKKFLLNEKGITTVALVVTIIILLILSMITVNMSMTNKGVVKETQNVVNMQSTQIQQEKSEVDNILKNK